MIFDRRRSRRGTALIVTLGLVAGCTTSPGAAPSSPAPGDTPGSPSDVASPPATPGTGALKVGYPSAPDYEDILMVEAFDRLNGRGWDIENVFFASPETAFGALAQNEVQMGTGAVTSAFTALTAGAPLKIVGNQQGVPWAIVGTEEVQTCDDLATSIFAVHSPGGTTTTYPLYWAETACSPEAAANIKPIYIEGSGTRAAAMLAGEIDATIIGPAEIAFLEREAPGRFHVLVDFAEDPALEGLNSSVFTFSESYLNENIVPVAEILKAISVVYSEAHEDPSILEKVAAANQLTYGDEEKAIIKYQLDTGTLDPNLTITRESIQFTIDYFQEYGDIQPGLEVDEIADFRPLREAGLVP